MEHVHHPSLTGGLLLMGIIPFAFDLPSLLSSLYYLVLLPPAIYQSYIVFRDHVFIKRDNSSLDKK